MSYSIIQPIGPIRPVDFTPLAQLFSALSVTDILFAVLLALLSQCVTALVLRKTPMYSNDSKNIPVYHIVIAIAVSTMLFFCGRSVLLLKGVIFLLILMYAAVCDIQTREVSDCVSVMIMIAAFIGAEPSDLIGMIAGGLFVVGLMLFCAVITKNRIGGADVKLSAACAFFLGVQSGIFGLMTGLLLSVIVNLILRRKDKAQGFPLVPYLAAGFTAAYILQGV